MSDRIEHETSEGSEVTDHLKSRSTWLRLAFMMLFVVIFYVAEFVLLAVALVQFLWKLFTGQPNGRLTGFGANLAEFIRQIACFLTYNTETMPFPFTDWPEVGASL